MIFKFWDCEIFDIDTIFDKSNEVYSCCTLLSIGCQNENRYLWIADFANRHGDTKKTDVAILTAG